MHVSLIINVFYVKETVMMTVDVLETVFVFIERRSIEVKTFQGALGMQTMTTRIVYGIFVSCEDCKTFMIYSFLYALLY